MRRLRRTEPLRALVRETALDPGDFIYPLFLCSGKGVRRPVGSMPGVFNLSIDEAVREAEEAASLGIAGLLLFGLPESKDELGSGAYDDNGIVQQGLRALKASAASKKLVLIADVCLCEYTSHGHCGKVIETSDGWTVDNDPSLDLLARTAVSQASAGADVVAPSDMMDGRVAAISRRRRGHGEWRRRDRLSADAHPQLRLQVRLRLLRPLPRGRRLRATIWRPQNLSNGWRQPPRGPA